MSKNETNFENYFDLSNPNLKSYFGKVVKGNDEIYDTPFAKGESTQHMLDEWNDHLESLTKTWPSLYDYEMEMKNKVGPLSFQLPLKERMSDIDSYYTDILEPAEPVSNDAIVSALHEWDKVRGLQIRSQRMTLAKMKLSTNSGSPYFRKRRNVVGDTIPCELQVVGSNVLQTLNSSTWGACAVLGWRGQEGGYSKEDVKQRVIWMFPLAVNIEELRVYQPLIEAAQRFDINPAWVSMDQVDKHITQLFDSKHPKDLIVCTDFTKFDQHFNHSLQSAARTMLEGILAPNQRSGWLNTVFPVKYMIPLAYNYGKIKIGLHGMGSGSGGTNADETLAHKCLQFEAALRAGTKLNPHSMCLGDDGILCYPKIRVEDVVSSYTTHGLEMNDSKQYADTQTCIYLRRWHHTLYRVDGICAGVYPTMRALGRLRYLERYYDPEVWGPRMVALRQLSILENVKYHPLKVEFVDFCMKRDKYRLGIDIPGFLDDIEAEVKKATDYMPDFLGYVRQQQNAADNAGIKSWWIYKYLKSKS